MKWWRCKECHNCTTADMIEYHTVTTRKHNNILYCQITLQYASISVLYATYANVITSAHINFVIGQLATTEQYHSSFHQILFHLTVPMFVVHFWSFYPFWLINRLQTSCPQGCQNTGVHKAVELPVKSSPITNLWSCFKLSKFLKTRLWLVLVTLPFGKIVELWPIIKDIYGFFYTGLCDKHISIQFFAY